ncbi:MAG: Ku protein [Hyphomicrobiales bacterium]
MADRNELAPPAFAMRSFPMAEIRSFWKGHLRLSLVSIPVRMVTATKREREIHFHQIHRASKQRINYTKTAPGVGEVDKDEIVQGFEVEPGNYVLLEDEELNALKLESRHTIELADFVDVSDIDPLYFDKPYYLLPDGEAAEEGYRVIRDALEKSGKAAIGQLTMRGRENLVALKPSGAGILLETMRYEDEIKQAEDVFSGIGKGKLRSDLVDMARELIEKRTTSFDPGKFKNHYTRALRDLVQTKLKHGKVAVESDDQKKQANVIDFMEALKRSVGKARPEPKGPKKRPGKPRRKSA